MRETRKTRAISIHNAHPRLRMDARSKQMLKRAVGLLDASARDGRFLGGCPAGELSLVFLTDAALAKLHAEFLGDPTTTDVITFEGAREMGGSDAAGEICVSVDTAEAYAKKHGRVFAEELLLYVVHGWLHLAGYDDLQPAKKRRMRAAEKRAMAILREAGAMPKFALK